MQAGIPSPSYAAPQTARPGDRADASRIRRTRSRWPTAYCGSPPPHRCTCESTGRAASPIASRRSARRRSTSSVVVDLQLLLLAVPADGGAQHQQVLAVGGPASRTQSHFWNEYVAALTCAAVDRRHQEPRPGTSGRSRARKASVTTAIEAYSIRASSSAASGATPAEQPRGRARRAWRPPPRRPRPARASRVGPTTRCHPPSAARARSRTVTPVRTSTAAPRPRPRQLPDPADQPGEHRVRREADERAGRGAARLASWTASRSSSATTWGTAARAEISRACPAYTPPSSGSTSRSSDLPAEPLLDEPADADVAVVEPGRRQHARPSPRGPAPGADRIPESASA